MQNTPFHAYWAARRLAGFADNEALLPVAESRTLKHWKMAWSFRVSLLRIGESLELKYNQ